jgi:hypothetical protein
MVIEKIKHIWAELRGHAPYTILGALAGIMFMLIFRNIGKDSAGVMFSIFHPSHVLLSAMVTASLFSIHKERKNFLLILVIGYVGSIGIATLSDSIIPYAGEKIFGLDVPTHQQLHATDAHQGHDEDAHTAGGHLQCGEDDHGGIHLGFIEDWYIVNPAAILGVLIAYLIPRTKFPHAGHVLISTWASSAHILMNFSGEISISIVGAVFIVLFIAVWLPCCISDIVFPLLFVKSDITLTDVCSCRAHAIHSHPHEHEHSDECPQGGEK